VEFAGVGALDAELESVTRSLLVVSWAMPPLVYPRAIQVSRTLKELSRRGWSIDVIAMDALSSNSEKRDEAFAAQYAGFYRLHPIDIRPAIASESRWWKRSGVLQRLLPTDVEGRAWTKLACERGRTLIDTNMPQALVTFAQPWSDHLVGISLKRRFPALPWIAHFSDPWVDSPYVQDEGRGVLSRWRTQEKEAIRRADGVLFVNQRTAQVVMSKYSADWGKKVDVVPHGFDPDLLPLLQNSEPTSPRLRFVHTGSMFNGFRDPLVFLKAVATLKEMIEPELMPTFDFVGSVDTQYAVRAKELEVDTIVRFGEPTPYLTSLQIASEADVLVVIDTNTPGSVFFPSKVVDYLMFGKPVLALTVKGGQTADILAPLGHVCVEGNDPAQIAAAIARMVQDHSAIAAMVKTRRSLADDYRISNTTRILEAAIFRAIERRQTVA
jgi:glycosyltransferase involved in cell wall biosynthesis